RPGATAGRVAGDRRRPRRQHVHEARLKRRRARAHRSAVTEELDELKGGWRRAWSTARMGTKLAAKSAGRMLFRGKPSRDDEDAAIADAKKLVARIGSLKGLAMKVGQIASYMPGGLPPRAQEVLAELQSTSQPMAWA